MNSEQKYYLKNFLTVLGIGVGLLIIASVYHGDGESYYSSETSYFLIALGAIVILAKVMADNFSDGKRK